MRKILNNFYKKVGLEIIVLVVSVFFVGAGFVYATLWNQAKTGFPTDPVDSVNWNALVVQVNSICGSNCNSATYAGAKATSSCPSGGFCLTQQNWLNFVDLFSQALSAPSCACQISPCGNWANAKSLVGFSKANWNALVDELNHKCTGSACSSHTNAAKISSSKLTIDNWNSFIELASTTINNCYFGVPTCTADCTASPGCLSSAPIHNSQSVTTATCCDGKACYKCKTGFSWDGNDCVAGCTPGCSSNQCGNDDCGHPCSYTCGTGEACDYSSGQCKPISTCNSTCALEGKVCGNDICGKTCLPGCSGNKICNLNVGQCEDSTEPPSNDLLSGSGTCDAYCNGKNSICNYVSTNPSVRNDTIRSITTDPKLGTKSCSDKTGATCGTALGNQSMVCEGSPTDWTYCHCTACSSKKGADCGQGLGDTGCLIKGKIDCNGNCIGASLLPAGTDCSVSSSSPASCDSNGKCIPCTANYNNNCGYDLGFLECIKLGKYDCKGACIGSSRLPKGTICGTSMTCNASAKCEACIADCNATNKQCGDDGCGNSQGCGVCNTGYTCSNNQCVLGDVAFLLSGVGSCDAFCSSKNGVCTSVGTDAEGKSGDIWSVTKDPKSGAESCSDKTGQSCSTELAGYTSVCNGYQAEWTNCRCHICSSNWKNDCSLLGDEKCITKGKYDCDGNCTGASYKAAGTSCGTELECDGSGKCITAPPVLIKLNIASSKSCNDICKNYAGDRNCVSVGSNATGENGLIESTVTDPKSGAISCAVIAGNCDAILNSAGTNCDGNAASWTYCKCSY
jgi:hypothetical protein